MSENGEPRRASDSNATVTLTLSYRPPIDWDALLAFLSARATPGVEVVANGSYARTVRVGERVGIIRVQRDAPRTTRGEAAPVIHLDMSAALVPSLMQVCARVRQLFDLDADPTKIESHLAASGFASLRELRHGLRVPGAFDGFELAIRAILGQQVSVKGATTLMARLTAAFGDAADVGDPSLTRVAVAADRLADARVSNIRAIGLTEARAATVHALARRVAAGELSLEADVDVRAVTRQLLDVPGIGPWTAEYIAMRALHWPDAFPSGDLVLRRRAGDVSAARLLKAAEAWRPWRAYAAMQLWMKVVSA
jgi:AraC family transcriptional regulator, regulatory protein of adaptative response / DNA-3-methyladenine glycosylase II